MTRFTQWLGALGRKLAERGNRRLQDLGPSGVDPGALFDIEVDPADERGRLLQLRGGDFNPPALKMWKLLLASGAWTHVLDIGANYGEMIFNVMAPAGARIVAVDANPAIIPYLTRNLARAGVRAQVICAGISDRVGTAAFLVDTYWSGMSHLAGEGEGESEIRRTTSVPTTTLPALLAGLGAETPTIRLALKIDIEGWEIRALRGSLDVIDQLADFAALVEVQHSADDDLAWIVEHFDIQLFEHATSALTVAGPFTVAALKERLNAPGEFYHLDVVLRRKKAASQ